MITRYLCYTIRENRTSVLLLEQPYIVVHNIKGDAVCQGKGKEDHQAIGRFDVRKGKKMDRELINLFVQLGEAEKDIILAAAKALLSGEEASSSAPA